MPNLFTDIPAVLPDELFEIIASTPNIKIERIVSRGHTTPEGEWYNQDWNEWVVLLQGTARLLFEDGEEVKLQVGDYRLIAAHEKHRVTYTAPDEDTVWLAVHFSVSDKTTN